jgi:hypothetical protein
VSADTGSLLSPQNLGFTPLSYPVEIDCSFDDLLSFFDETNLIRLFTPYSLFSHTLSALSNEFAISLGLKMVYFFPGILGDRRQTPRDIDVSRTAPTLGLNQVMDERRVWNASLKFRQIRRDDE